MKKSSLAKYTCANCGGVVSRISQRCKPGNWKSYQDLEKEIETLRNALDLYEKSDHLVENGEIRSRNRELESELSKCRNERSALIEAIRKHRDANPASCPSYSDSELYSIIPAPLRHHDTPET